MFDFGIGYSELLVVAIVALIAIGPKDLPRALHLVGRYIAKMRGMAQEFRSHLDDAVREAGLEEVKKELQAVKALEYDLDPLKPKLPDAAKNEIKPVLDNPKE